MTNERQAKISCEVVKTDASRRLVFGYLLVCKVDGEEYHDLDGSAMPEDVMLDAALDWAKTVKPADVMHEGGNVGTHPFLFPLTTEVAKAYGFDNPPKTGLMIAQQVDAATFERFESGELTGFSVDGGGMVEFE